MLQKVYDGRRVGEKTVTLPQLRELDPKPATTEVVEEAVAHLEMLLETLASRVDDAGRAKHVLHAVTDVTDNLVGERIPVVFCGASGVGQLAQPADDIERTLRDWRAST